ncbi:CoA-binding protein [Siansivirga zeaxanthinifaciens]|uniref:CoA-binding protein n=1 Tax=Siansivirga zeaxanthinifaciens CC-SAMT-1 TaxID=1454006 RepID=A0A0C5VWD4_9FLAO|nr:CoA-binding protein [Siansivirga zeaxanthinifaciens]AJR03416.1 CoA-binding protein [Siansivirga zeaxanthinifaciens CC-SAMT-1]
MNKKTLVVGASLKPDRYSNFAIRKLKNSNIEVVALGLKSGEVAGVFISKDLVDYKDIHTVTLYLNPQNQIAYYDYIVSLKPKRVIFNPGTENSEFYKILDENNINYEVACTLVLLSTNQF